MTAPAARPPLTLVVRAPGLDDDGCLRAVDLAAGLDGGAGRAAVLLAAGDPIAPSRLESVVRVDRDGAHRVRLAALARALGRPRNHVARELSAVPPATLGELASCARALLVEGATDRAVLRVLLERLGEEHAIVVAAGSKDRLAALHLVLRALAIPHHVLFDGDGGPIPGGPAQRHRILRSRREATESLVAVLGADGAPAGPAATWGFGDPTAVGRAWSAFGVDLEDELSRWPSFLAALAERGVPLAAKRSAALESAARRAELADCPSSFREVCAAVAGLPDDGTGPEPADGDRGVGADA